MPYFVSRRLALAAGAALAAPFLARPALAQADARTGGWPDRPIRLVVPFAPGGSNDAIARPLAEGLQARLGQPLVVENRAGAGSTVGSGVVAKAAADGYTLLIASSSFTTSAAIQRTPYDPVGSFDAVAPICTAPMLVVTAPNSEFRGIGALLAHARAHPGELRYGTAGPGNIGHMASAYLDMVAGVQTEAVPYAGIGPAQIDLVAGRLDFMITTLASVRGQVDAGRLPVIAYTGDERPAAAPQVPTVREATGLDYAVEAFWGLLAPRGLPAPVLARLNATVNEVLADPAYHRFLAAEGAVPRPGRPEALAATVRGDLERWRKVAAASGISAG
jgi:tripartite-type tricarboxylate transporter receptor subunit TctC